jgi:DNA-binding response OmpR family regulator
MDMRVCNADILIVDDEPTMTRALARMLELSGYDPRIANSGEEALDLIERHSFDLVLLDLRMPGMDGLEVLAAARALAPGTTFVILTAHGSLDSAITAMRWGASDYLLKPCSVDEIVETVRRGLEKRWRARHREQLVGLLKETLAEVNAEEKTVPVAPESESGILKLGSLTLDTQWRSVAVNGEVVKLSATEYQVLAHFAHHVNQVVTCSELVHHTHGLDLSEQDARPIIRMHIHRLRQKLESNPSQPRFLRTVRGVGYMFVADNHTQV